MCYKMIITFTTSYDATNYYYVVDKDYNIMKIGKTYRYDSLPDIINALIKGQKSGKVFTAVGPYLDKTIFHIRIITKFNIDSLEHDLLEFMI